MKKHSVRSKLLSAKKLIIIKEVDAGKFVIKQGSHHSEAKQLTYWKTDEAEEDVENVTIVIYGLLAHYIAGDLNLSELNTWIRLIVHSVVCLICFFALKIVLAV